MDEAFIVDWQTEVGAGGGQVFGILASLPAPAMSCETSLSRRGFIVTFVTSTVTSETGSAQTAGCPDWLAG